MYLNNPSTIGTCKHKDFFVGMRKIYEKFSITTCLLLPKFRAITGCDTISYFFNVSILVVFERASTGVRSFKMTVELGSSNIKTESVKNEVTKFIQRRVVMKSKGLLRLV